MDDPAAVGDLDGVGQHRHQGGGGGGRLGGVRQAVGERPALHQLHRVERQPLVLAAVEHLHQVGVVQAGHGPGLAQEPGHRHATGVGPAQQHLDRHRAAQPQVGGPVHHADAAAAQH